MRKIGSGLFFLGLSLFITWEALRVGLGTPQQPGSGFIPLCVAIILFFLSLALIYQNWNVRVKRKEIPVRVVLALATLFAYSLVLETLGFIISTFIMVGILFRLGQPRRWWVLIGMSAAATGSAYFIFGHLLSVFFPRGILGI